MTRKGGEMHDIAQGILHRTKAYTHTEGNEESMERKTNCFYLKLFKNYSESIPWNKLKIGVEKKDPLWQAQVRHNTSTMRGQAYKSSRNSGAPQNSQHTRSGTQIYIRSMSTLEIPQLGTKTKNLTKKEWKNKRPIMTDTIFCNFCWEQFRVLKRRSPNDGPKFTKLDQMVQLLFRASEDRDWKGPRAPGVPPFYDGQRV